MSLSRQSNTWLGALARPDLLNHNFVRTLTELADAARGYNWQRVIELLDQTPDGVNATRPGGSALFALLHQVAHGGAPVEVASKLIALGAWRTLRTASGEQPVDIARRLNHDHLIEVLTPQYRHRVPLEALALLQVHFHDVISAQVDFLGDMDGLRYPELEPLLELEEPQMWFAVPGMYGGFWYWLAADGDDPVLMSESSSRVVGGFGETYEVTIRGSALSLGSDHPAVVWQPGK